MPRGHSCSRTADPGLSPAELKLDSVATVRISGPEAEVTKGLVPCGDLRYASSAPVRRKPDPRMVLRVVTKDAFA